MSTPGESSAEAPLPATAVPAGHLADGSPAFVGRAWFRRHLLPGSVVPASGFAFVPLNGFQVYRTEFQRHSRGGVPHNAVWAGLDADGSNIYVGRAMHERDLLPGKVVPNKGGLFVAYGGGEHAKFDYEVLVNWHSVAWQQCSGGHVPPRAIVGGHTVTGERLFIGRVMHDGALTPGKIHGSHRKCYIPFAGREIAFDQYEVLISV